MKKWEMINCPPTDAEGWLKKGWEPFAVTVEKDSATAAYNAKYVVWLRREVSK